MQSRKCILSAFTLSAATAFGVAAMAADLPKEGTFSGTLTGHGTYRTLPIGKERVVLVYDVFAAAVSNGLTDHMTWHCVGLGDYTKGVGHDHGYCVAADLSGDQLATDWVVGNHPLGKDINGSFTITTGTGKFAGISGSGTTVDRGNEFPGPGEGAFITQVAVQGSYKLP